MAKQAKQPHIRIDEDIWDDPVIAKLSDAAFRAYILAIAWCKSQHGRTPDGILTEYGAERIKASSKTLKELVDSKLLTRRDSGHEVMKYSEWQVTAAEEKEIHDRAAENGSRGGTRRWSQVSEENLPPLEEGFDVDAAFKAAWDNWPAPVDPKLREGRAIAFDAFRANITNTKDFEAFSAALMHRLRAFRSSSEPKEVKRRFLGAFKNFCTDRWKDWIPKSHQTQLDPGAKPAAEPEPAAEAAPKKRTGGAYVDPELLADMRAFDEEQRQKAV